MAQNALQSKTVLFNALYAMVAVAGLFGWVDYKPDQTTVEVVAVVIAGINIYLRLRKLPPQAESLR